MNFNSYCDSECPLRQRQIAELLFVTLSTHQKLHLLCVPDTASLVDVRKPYWPNFSNASIYSIIRHSGTPTTSKSGYKLSAFENQANLSGAFSSFELQATGIDILID